MAVQIPGPIDLTRFREEVRMLRDRPVHGRVVDALQPLRADIAALKDEGRTIKEIWEAVVAAGLKATYPNFVRAVNELLANKVRPLQEARRRARAKRLAPMAVPTSLAAPAAVAPVKAPAQAASLENPIMQMAQDNLAAGLRDFVVKKKH